MKPKLAVVGAAGRMGKRIISLALETGDFQLVSALESRGHPDIGKDCAALAGSEPCGIAIGTEYPADADVVMRFRTALVAAGIPEGMPSR